jgi:hypothetical protein
MRCPVAWFPIVETSTASLLHWSCLVARIVPGCSVADTGFLPIGCSGGTAAAAKGTASETAIDADVDSGAGAL